MDSVACIRPLRSTHMTHNPVRTHLILTPSRSSNPLEEVLCKTKNYSCIASQPSQRPRRFKFQSFSEKQPVLCFHDVPWRWKLWHEWNENECSHHHQGTITSEIQSTTFFLSSGCRKIISIISMQNSFKVESLLAKKISWLQLERDNRLELKFQEAIYPTSNRVIPARKRDISTS